MDTFLFPNTTKYANGAGTYLIATAFIEDGVQIFNVTDPNNIVIPGTNTTKAAAGFANLDGASDVATWDQVVVLRTQL